MFEFEKPTHNDSALYNKISEGRWNEKYAKWCIDREQGFCIICIGKRGVETPYFFNMNYKDEIITICVWDISDIPFSEGSEDVWVYIPASLSNYKDDISRVVLEAYSDNVYAILANVYPSLTRIQTPEIKEIRFRIKERLL